VKKDRRQRPRQASLLSLTQSESGKGDVDAAAKTFCALQWPYADPPTYCLRAFASALAHETVSRLADADALIADTAERWRPERMAVIDRLILRLSVTELLRQEGPPPAVIINEALELARTFSTEEAVKFINGMLDAIRKKIEAR